MRRAVRAAVRWLAVGLALGLCLPVAWRLAVGVWYRPLVFDAASVPARRVALVFGAGIYRGGGLSPMLEDRVETAVRLYETGKVERLLFSGDNRYVDYNEPGEMTAYAVARGVPASHIQPDYAGRRTYDSCYRARHIFQLKGVIVVSQGFHVPRALFLCRHVGLDAVAVAADRRAYLPSSWAWSQLRELPALAGALVDVIRQRPAAVMGDPIWIQ
ncbi:hypothetical protein DCC79_10120 [bacterium]|nr:hypothetical protein [Chloroflexi bacterium CFX6]RIL09744.1 MAG: hypothetical protein DCC79_10120 [bacterium]